jgi:hypothetical protein
MLEEMLVLEVQEMLDQEEVVELVELVNKV